jgi:hypothetical protein
MHKSKSLRIVWDKYSVAFIFILIMILLSLSKAFPALYGDEYGSLFESYHLRENLHAIGYFSQLWLWNELFQADVLLRFLSNLWLGLGIYWLKAWLEDWE